MSSSIGDNIKISVFGESHGEAIGCVIDGLPAGVKLDMDAVYKDMSRRAPGKDKTATPRLERIFRIFCRVFLTAQQRALRLL